MQDRRRNLSNMFLLQIWLKIQSDQFYINRPEKNKMHSDYLYNQDLSDEYLSQTQTVDTNQENQEVLKIIVDVLSCLYTMDQTSLKNNTQVEMIRSHFQFDTLDQIPAILLNNLDDLLESINMKLEQENNFIARHNKLLDQKNEILILSTLINSYLFSLGKKKLPLQNAGLRVISNFVQTPNDLKDFNRLLEEKYPFVIQKRVKIQELTEQYFRNKNQKNQSITKQMVAIQLNVLENKISNFKELKLLTLKFDNHLNKIRLPFVISQLFEFPEKVQDFYPNLMIIACPPAYDHLFEQAKTLMKQIITNKQNGIAILYLNFVLRHQKQNPNNPTQKQITGQLVRSLLIEGIDSAKIILWQNPNIYGFFYNQIYCNIGKIYRQMLPRYGKYLQKESEQILSIIKTSICVIMFHQLTHYLLCQLGFGEKNTNNQNSNEKIKQTRDFFNTNQNKNSHYFASFEKNFEAVFQINEVMLKGGYQELLKQNLEVGLKALTRWHVFEFLTMYQAQLFRQIDDQMQSLSPPKDMEHAERKAAVSFSRFVRQYLAKLPQKLQLIEKIRDWQFMLYELFRSKDHFPTLYSLQKFESHELIQTPKQLHQKLKQIPDLEPSREKEINRISDQHQQNFVVSVLPIVSLFYCMENLYNTIGWYKLPSETKGLVSRVISLFCRLCKLNDFLDLYNKRKIEPFHKRQKANMSNILFPNFDIYKLIHAKDSQILNQLSQVNDFQQFERIRNKFGSGQKNENPFKVNLMIRQRKGQEFCVNLGQIDTYDMTYPE